MSSSTSVICCLGALTCRCDYNAVAQFKIIIKLKNGGSPVLNYYPHLLPRWGNQQKRMLA